MIPGNIPEIMFNNSSCYEIRNSSLLSNSSNQYYSRTHPIYNQTGLEISMWVKRGYLSTVQVLLSSWYYGSGDSNHYEIIYFDANNKLCWYYIDSAIVQIQLASNAVFSDPTSWYHIYVVKSATGPQIYVNGNPVVMTGTGLTVTSGYLYGGGSMNQYIGYQYSAYPFDGYISECYLINRPYTNQSIYDFGEYCSITGEWQPKKYNKVFGSKDTYLEFKDSTNLGKDSTPNALNFNTSGGIGSINQFVDTPTNNFPTWNPISSSGTTVYRYANLQASSAGNTSTWYRHDSATMVLPSIGKYYWEYQNLGSSNLDYVVVGLLSTNTSSYGPGPYLGSSSGSYGFYVINSGGTLYYYPNGETAINLGASLGDTPQLTLSPIIGLAFDADNNTIELFIDNVSKGIKTISSTFAGTLRPAASIYDGNLHINFGQTPFVFNPPAGFKILCSRNLPTPVIQRPEAYFKAITYTGNGANLQVGEIQKAQDLVTIDHSLRFNSADSAYLSRTFNTPTNNKKWTWSAWVKCSKINGTSPNQLLSAYADLTNRAVLNIEPSGKLTYLDYIGNSVISSRGSDVLFKDSSAHINLVCVYDTDNAIANDRICLYANGIKLVCNTSVNPPLGYSSGKMNTAMVHSLGKSGAEYLDAYLSDVHFVDGQALDPSYFGQYDGNNYWVPKTYTGTYGANGFKLDFTDGSSNAALGYDHSGNGNNWTVNNIAATGGSPNQDLVVDTPTNSYATLDPNTSLITSKCTLTNGNLYGTSFYNDQAMVASSLKLSNGVKYYAETVFSNASQTTSSYCGIVSKNGKTKYYSLTGQFYNNGTWSAYGSSFVSGDIIGIAVDLINYKIEFFKNNISQGIANIEANDEWYFLGSCYIANGYAYNYWNFGQQGFTYTPPAGFLPLCENNISEYTYDIEKPDLVWIKSRSAATNHMLFDSVRGVKKYISSNLITAEATDENSLIQFNKNGFYIGNNANINTLNASYVAWMWKQGVTPGFDITTWTGTGSLKKVSHSLGAIPSMIIIKNLNSASAHWPVYHKMYNNGVNPILYATYLSYTNSMFADSGYVLWGNSAPTTADFSVNTDLYVNAVSNNYIAYLFAEVPGFSKFGSYVGNGSTDGPFVHCGFRPAFVLIKGISAVNSWNIFDSARNPSNKEGMYDLFPEATTIDYSGGAVDIDMLSNGFKIKDVHQYLNTSGQSYIFAAFAEMPSKYALAR